MTLPDSIKENSQIILFDGVCNLCSAFLQFVYKYDSKKIYKYTWVQEEKGREILVWLGIPTDEYETIILSDLLPNFISSTFLFVISSRFIM